VCTCVCDVSVCFDAVVMVCARVFVTCVAYIKRVIAHPSFHNVDYRKCEKLMDTMDQGDVIIRPSSKVCINATCIVADICLSVCLSVSVCLLLYLPVCLSVCLPACLSVNDSCVVC